MDENNQNYQYDQRSDFEDNLSIGKEINTRKTENLLLAYQLAPLLDRMGRLLIDLAPHLAQFG